jgi:hypothetical protein
MAQRPQQRRLSALSQHLIGAAPTAQSWPSMVPEKGTSKPKLAIVSTQWRQNSHSEHMGDCFMHGWGIGGVWHEPAVELVSMCECPLPICLSLAAWNECVCAH